MKQPGTIILAGAGVVAIGGAVLIAREAEEPKLSANPTSVQVENNTGKDTTVYFAFGADSVVKPADWTFCTGQGLVCQFPLKAHASQELPTGGRYLNTTFAFGTTVGCGSTKAELNINNPKWYDVLDISLVDGYSNDIVIEATDAMGTTKLGPPNGQSGNEKVMGLYPFGCDICVARQHPPCGIQPGNGGCKTGDQYKPDVPCQFQGKTMSGGERVKVSLVESPTKF